MRVKILGAGSVGNHHAFSCRKYGLDVTVMDRDRGALDRMQTKIYPSRYGAWDQAIALTTSDDSERWDLIIVATPPNSHLELAETIIRKKCTKALLIEKPLGPPDIEKILRFKDLCDQTNIQIFIGYNHLLTQHSVEFERLVKELKFSKPLQMNVFFKEHWQGILDAHPWLDGPQASYLGSFTMGGGATCEHSHAINAFQHFSNIFGEGRIHQISCDMAMVQDEGTHYDQLSQMNVKTEKGLVGHIQQDVITSPPIKTAICQFANGQIRWTVNHRPGMDSVEVYKDQKSRLIEFKKTRPDDFHFEIKHIIEIVEGRESYDTSPIHIKKGVDTMIVICAAFMSHRKKEIVVINYNEPSVENIFSC